MTTKAELAREVKPRSVKIYEVKEYENLLKGVTVASCMLTDPPQVVDEQSVIRRLSALTLNRASEGNCCSCCGVGPFESRAHQTSHYKHHWHTHNLKRKLFGKPALTYGQFSSRQDDGSSVSGSDSEEEVPSQESELFAAATRHCKAFFTNHYGQVFCIYRCIIHHRKEVISFDGNGKAWVARCERFLNPYYQRWAMFMVSGGHFAGAIFSGGAAVLHKTLHAYVTRKGQGQAQATRDGHGNAPRSAGASLRRHNNQRFLENVQQIMASWADDLLYCPLVLYRAVGSLNQAALFGKLSPLKRDDTRLRALPFPTRKPTYKELKRAFDIVTNIEVYDSMELFQKALIASRANNNKSAAKTSSDSSVASGKKPQKSPNKPIDRAKSRERPPRELPIQITSSEDEGPCYIDSETPADWIQTLSKQSSTITDSRKNLLINDCSIASSRSESGAEDTFEIKEERRKKKKKKQEDKKEDERKKELEGTKQEDGKKQEEKKQEDEKKQEEAKKQEANKKIPQKIPANVKKMWKAILAEPTSLETILESFEGCDLDAACNAQDPADGNTALHKAAIAAKAQMVTQILTAGGDPCIRNHALQTPYAASPHHDTRVAFRLFQAQHPDKYNYAKSHIPGPITLELLEQEKEKKVQQKRAKRQRDKEKQIEKIKSNKYLLLTDAQKLKSDEPRCFVCGTMLPKMAFEYDNFKFCSMPCLQNHRHLRPLNLTVH